MTTMNFVGLCNNFSKTDRAWKYVEVTCSIVEDIQTEYLRSHLDNDRLISRVNLQDDSCFVNN